jgi:site-specific DNA-methyltransferase (cytosine-N4-specific)
LLTKYFMDMQKVFAGMVAVLRPGSPAYVVIGNNHTIAGGERVEIETANLLVDIAKAVGMVSERRIPMEMLVSRDIFRKNAVASEEILCFRTPV